MGLLDDAVAPTIDTYEAPVTQGVSTGYDATKLDAPAQTTGTNYQAQDASANLYDPTNQNDAVTYDATKVEDRLTGLISQDSAYMQDAKTQALIAQNKRGTANSSMAIGAGHQAAIRAALPIAQQDASSMSQASQVNAGAANAVNANNAQFANQASITNVNAENQVELSNQSAQNRAALDNANITNTADQLNTSAENQFAQLNQAADTQADQYNATVANEFGLKNQAALNDAASAFASANNAASIENASNNMKLLLANAEEELSNYDTDIKRKTALDGIARDLINSGLSNGLFATSDGAANWISMIGDLYPDMGLSVTTQLATESATEVV